MTPLFLLQKTLAATAAAKRDPTKRTVPSMISLQSKCNAVKDTYNYIQNHSHQLFKQPKRTDIIRPQIQKKAFEFFR